MEELRQKASQYVQLQDSPLHKRLSRRQPLDFDGSRSLNRKSTNGTDGKLPHSAQMSRVSLSRYRLDNMAKEKNWEYLDNFGLEELRDGFFDATFSKPTKIVSNEEEQAGDKRTLLGNFAIKHGVYHQYKSVKRYICAFVDNIEPTTKFSLAIFIAIVICVIHPSGRWIGHEFRYFLPISVLLHHPVRTVGSQIEISLMSILGGALGLGWSALAWYVSTVSKPAANYQGGLLFASLALGITFSTWFKGYYQRLLYICMSFNNAMIFLHTASLALSKQNLKWLIFWDFGISYLFGILLSLVICMLWVPHSGHSALMDHFINVMNSTKEFLVAFIDQDKVANQDLLHKYREKMINSSNIELSKGFREFANQFSASRFSQRDLKELRNTLTRLVNPLRVLPTKQELLDKDGIERLQVGYFGSKLATSRIGIDNSYSTGTMTPATPSGIATPIWDNNYQHTMPMNTEIVISILRKAFVKETFGILLQMISLLEIVSKTLKIYKKRILPKSLTQTAKEDLNKVTRKLKRKVLALDAKYKEFIRTDFFSQENFRDPSSVDIFLYLKIVRNSAKNLIEVGENCLELCEHSRWRITFPSYPLHRSLRRLSNQSSLDQGSGNVLHYFETKKDVDEIFEKMYNEYTSRHKFVREGQTNNNISVRAIDHTDFSLHTTQNPWRYKLWKLSTLLVGGEMKWTVKKVFILTFLCLPGWLPRSHKWFGEYHCWWAAFAFNHLSHRRFSGNWTSLMWRFMLGLIGIFWAWAANQARHFGSPYVICTFAGLMLLPFATNYLVYENTKSSFTALLCFIVIVLEPYSREPSHLDTAVIWKCTWVTGLALLIGILISIPINWLVWSFKARSELKLAMSSLFSHISQSYQTVADRYLYRDAGDAPTELTLAFSHIREVRLTTSVVAAGELLSKAEHEPNLISNFNPETYRRLLRVCNILVEKIIEARMSGLFFEVWEEDADNEASRALLSLRRDSVSSVIFIFYVLSNCFMSKRKVPKYLPNPVLSRKKLYDFIAKADNRNDVSGTSNKELKDVEKAHWREVHGVAFVRAFTDISEAMETLVTICKELLGEDTY